MKEEDEKKNRLHDNPMIEMVLISDIMKECGDGKLPGYVQYVAMRPFITLMYTEFSINLLKEAKILNLDATGSLVQRLHRWGISKDVLYYALVMKVPGLDLPQLPVAEMLSSDQSAATISSFLANLKRDYYRVTGNTLHQVQVETDMSFAMIHGVLGT